MFKFNPEKFEQFLARAGETPNKRQTQGMLFYLTEGLEGEYLPIMSWFIWWHTPQGYSFWARVHRSPIPGFDPEVKEILSHFFDETLPASKEEINALL